MRTEDKITVIKGVGEKNAALFQKLDIFSIGDLIYNYPRTYASYPKPVSRISDINEDGYYAVSGRITAPLSVKKTGRMDITLGRLFMTEGEAELVWFRMPYMKSKVSVGRPYIFYGIVRNQGGKLKLEQPKVYEKEEYLALTEGLFPVYSLTKGLTNEKITKMVAGCFGQMTVMKDHMPADILSENGLLPLREALYHIHFPENEEDYRKARKRLVFDEFFDFSMEFQRELSEVGVSENPLDLSKNEMQKVVLSKLPFELTEGQKQAVDDINSDLEGDHITQRLIQGDVGSGKTIVAFLAMVRMAENGYQSVIMAPTEVLANQHYKTFCEMLSNYALPYTAVLLTGSMKAAEKRKAKEAVSSGEALFVIGTHALFQEGVHYNDLGLVITDEQHRFGVKQRKLLTEKGRDVFSIVMSATPIPRTLAMILYTGMNISVIPATPAERLPVKNALVGPDKRAASYKHIAKEIAAGHQAMIICPMVEASIESDKTEAENATDYAEKIKSFFDPSVRIGILHGRLTPDKKDAVMSAFAAGELDIIVSTTVIEVGVNVPNATVIMIENADRFGLAQLHQLRGRVGRGSAQSYCILIDTSEGKKNSERLSILASSNDGFYIAGEDLKLRGAGDMLGIRQSGDMSFKIADIFADSELLEAARDAAKSILKTDPHLESETGRAISEHLRQVRARQYTNL